MQAAVQTTTSVVRNWRICFILTSLIFAASALADEPPANLIRRIAARETETAAAQSNYTYRQSVTIEEFNDHGAKGGLYREVRDIIFSPQQERTEQMIGKPADSLSRLKLTDEDFRDIREVQPFLLTKDQIFMYETTYRGEEKMDGIDCYVVQIRPRQLLQGQRLFEGMLWVAKTDFSIIRSEGQAVPQIRSLKSENLFPHFTTLREKVDGDFWFPVTTYADDTLYFRTGPQRIKFTIQFANYRKFGADSKVTFEK